MQFKVSDDGRIYKALTADRVYEIRMQGHGAHWASWELRIRNRDSIIGHALNWRVIGTYKNPATAMAYARHEEEEN